MKEKDKEVVDLEQINIIVKIPKNTVFLEINPTVIDGKDILQKYTKEMDLGEVNKARKDFLDNVEDGDDYDGYYVITDKGREWLNQLEGINDEK